ncbi:hypothetical protein [Anaerorhabdus sp.]|uniref:hypothetical protein n=1 Tax=Anaerorhabdus sp. TaxID=1872524 RepID=UPI002FCA6034
MKKLMGLLFEDEEVIEEEIIDEPVSTPLPLKREEKKHVQQSQPIQQQPVQRVEKQRVVEQPTPIRVYEESDGLSIPTNKHVVKEEPKPEAKKISMDVDDLIAAKATPVRQTRETVVTPNKKKAAMSSGYEFSPVISPIFGVDEKDANAVIPTSPMKKVGDSHIGTIISPMYGMDKDAEPTVAPVNTKNVKATESEIKAERDMINLTLDDILARTAAISGKKKNVEQPTFDEIVAYQEETEEVYSDKKVINNRNMSLFDEDGE